MEGSEQLQRSLKSHSELILGVNVNPEHKLQDDSHAEDGPLSNATDADAALDTDSDEWCVISDKD